MENLLVNWFLLIGVFSIAVISPGPDFIMVIRNSILYSRTIGIITAFGLAFGVCVHVTYTLIGIAALIAQSVLLFNILKYAGAAYLLYIGFKSLRSRGFKADESELDKTKNKKDITALKALSIGFLTNVLNPKATLFFLAVFSQFITPETSITAQIIYSTTCASMVALWFSGVAIVLTNQKIKSVFLKFTKWIDRVCGGLLIALGIKLALSKV